MPKLQKCLAMADSRPHALMVAKDFATSEESWEKR